MNHEAKSFSVAEAAAMIGVSEKTIRRRIKAGELVATKEPLDGGGIGWRVLLDSAMDTVVDSVPEGAMDTRRNQDGQQGGQSLAQTTNATDKGVDTTGARAGTRTDTNVDAHAHDFIPQPDDRRVDRDAQEIARQREEILFLRGLVEQHQRSEAELRASLREALRAMPKQITAGDAPATRQNAPESPQNATASNVPNPTPDAVKLPQKRAQRPLWKVMFGIR